GFDTAKEAQKKNEVLLAMLQRELNRYVAKDRKCKFIHPDNAMIRFSNALAYWGMHIVDGTRPQLAFREVAERSYPRIDFLKLAEYLQHHTDIDAAKAEGA